MKDGDDSQKGIPSYKDTKARSLSDPAHPYIEVADWFPANEAASKVWRCVEGLRDILNLIGDIQPVDNLHVLRRIKVLVTPLYSFCQAVHALCNYLADTPGIAKQIPGEQLKQLNELRKYLQSQVPLHNDAPLREVRDKMSAHIDRNISPSKAHDIVAQVTPEIAVKWLHSSIAALMESLNLDVYAWGVEDHPPGYVKLMNSEPFVVTFELDSDGNPHAIAAIEITRSPKYIVAELCYKALAKSVECVKISTSV